MHHQDPSNAPNNSEEHHAEDTHFAHLPVSSNRETAREYYLAKNALLRKEFIAHGQQGEENGLTLIEPKKMLAGSGQLSSGRKAGTTTLEKKELFLTKDGSKLDAVIEDGQYSTMVLTCTQAQFRQCLRNGVFPTSAFQNPLTKMIAKYGEFKRKVFKLATEEHETYNNWDQRLRVVDTAQDLTENLQPLMKRLNGYEAAHSPHKNVQNMIQDLEALHFKLDGQRKSFELDGLDKDYPDKAFYDGFLESQTNIETYIRTLNRMLANPNLSENDVKNILKPYAKGQSDHTDTSLMHFIQKELTNVTAYTNFAIDSAFGTFRDLSGLAKTAVGAQIIAEDIGVDEVDYHNAFHDHHALIFNKEDANKKISINMGQELNVNPGEPLELAEVVALTHASITSDPLDPNSTLIEAARDQRNSEPHIKKTNINTVVQSIGDAFQAMGRWIGNGVTNSLGLLGLDAFKRKSGRSYSEDHYKHSEKLLQAYQTNEVTKSLFDANHKPLIRMQPQSLIRNLVGAIGRTLSEWTVKPLVEATQYVIRSIRDTGPMVYRHLTTNPTLLTHERMMDILNESKNEDIANYRENELLSNLFEKSFADKSPNEFKKIEEQRKKLEKKAEANLHKLIIASMPTYRRPDDAGDLLAFTLEFANDFGDLFKHIHREHPLAGVGFTAGLAAAVPMGTTLFAHFFIAKWLLAHINEPLAKLFVGETEGFMATFSTGMIQGKLTFLAVDAILEGRESALAEALRLVAENPIAAVAIGVTTTMIGEFLATQSVPMISSEALSLEQNAGFPYLELSLTGAKVAVILAEINMASHGHAHGHHNHGHGHAQDIATQVDVLLASRKAEHRTEFYNAIKVEEGMVLVTQDQKSFLKGIAESRFEVQLREMVTADCQKRGFNTNEMHDLTSEEQRAFNDYRITSEANYRLQNKAAVERQYKELLRAEAIKLYDAKNGGNLTADDANKAETNLNQFEINLKNHALHPNEKIRSRISNFTAKIEKAVDLQKKAVLDPDHPANAKSSEQVLNEQRERSYLKRQEFIEQLSQINPKTKSPKQLHELMSYVRLQFKNNPEYIASVKAVLYPEQKSSRFMTSVKALGSVIGSTLLSGVCSIKYLYHQFNARYGNSEKTASHQMKADMALGELKELPKEIARNAGTFTKTVVGVSARLILGIVGGILYVPSVVLGGISNALLGKAKPFAQAHRSYVKAFFTPEKLSQSVDNVVGNLRQYAGAQDIHLATDAMLKKTQKQYEQDMPEKISRLATAISQLPAAKFSDKAAMFFGMRDRSAPYSWQELSHQVAKLHKQLENIQLNSLAPAERYQHQQSLNNLKLLADVMDGKKQPRALHHLTMQAKVSSNPIEPKGEIKAAAVAGPILLLDAETKIEIEMKRSIKSAKAIHASYNAFLKNSVNLFDDITLATVLQRRHEREAEKFIKNDSTSEEKMLAAYYNKAVKAIEFVNDNFGNMIKKESEIARAFSDNRNANTTLSIEDTAHTIKELKALKQSFDQKFENKNEPQILMVKDMLRVYEGLYNAAVKANKCLSALSEKSIKSNLSEKLQKDPQTTELVIHSIEVQLQNSAQSPIQMHLTKPLDFKTVVIKTEYDYIRKQMIEFCSKQGESVTENEKNIFRAALIKINSTFNNNSEALELAEKIIDNEFRLHPASVRLREYKNIVIAELNKLHYDPSPKFEKIYQSLFHDKCTLSITGAKSKDIMECLHDNAVLQSIATLGDKNYFNVTMTTYFQEAKRSIEELQSSVVLTDSTQKSSEYFQEAKRSIEELQRSVVLTDSTQKSSEIANYLNDHPTLSVAQSGFVINELKSILHQLERQKPESKEGKAQLNHEKEVCQSLLVIYRKIHGTAKHAANTLSYHTDIYNALNKPLGYDKTLSMGKALNRQQDVDGKNEVIALHMLKTIFTKDEKLHKIVDNANTWSEAMQLINDAIIHKKEEKLDRSVLKNLTSTDFYSRQKLTDALYKVHAEVTNIESADLKQQAKFHEQIEHLQTINRSEPLVELQKASHSFMACKVSSCANPQLNDMATEISNAKTAISSLSLNVSQNYDDRQKAIVAVFEKNPCLTLVEAGKRIEELNLLIKKFKIQLDSNFGGSNALPWLNNLLIAKNLLEIYHQAYKCAQQLSRPFSHHAMLDGITIESSEVQTKVNNLNTSSASAPLLSETKEQSLLDQPKVVVHDLSNINTKDLTDLEKDIFKIVAEYKNKGDLSIPLTVSDNSNSNEFREIVINMCKALDVTLELIPPMRISEQNQSNSNVHDMQRYKEMFRELSAPTDNASSAVINDKLLRSFIKPLSEVEKSLDGSHLKIKSEKLMKVLGGLEEKLSKRDSNNLEMITKVSKLKELLQTIDWEQMSVTEARSSAQNVIKSVGAGLRELKMMESDRMKLAQQHIIPQRAQAVVSNNSSFTPLLTGKMPIKDVPTPQAHSLPPTIPSRATPTNSTPSSVIKAQRKPVPMPILRSAKPVEPYNRDEKQRLNLLPRRSISPTIKASGSTDEIHVKNSPSFRRRGS